MCGASPQDLKGGVLAALLFAQEARPQLVEMNMRLEMIP